MRSDTIKSGLERTPHRALLKGTGVPQNQMDKPFIGVATSFTDLIPGHVGMRDLERFIEKGVHSGGGYSFFFGIPGVCDGMAMGHKGMHYSLPTRELIADMVESVAEAHRLDGLVLLTNCDNHSGHADGGSPSQYSLYRRYCRSDDERARAGRPQVLFCFGYL